MKKEYVISKQKACFFNEDLWQSLQKVEINCFPWDNNGYRPRTEAALFYNDKGLFIAFRSFEEKVTVRYFNLNEPVCMDSCVEFFINPLPDMGQGYMNFELNAAGNLLLQIRKSKSDIKPVEPAEVPQFEIKASIGREKTAEYSGPYYTVEFHIPFGFIKRYFEGFVEGSGTVMEANFYKCGGEVPHFGCWSPVATEKPDYHRPEYFGRLILD